VAPAPAPAVVDAGDARRADAALVKALISGFFMNVCRLGVDGRSHVVVKANVEAFLHPSSCLAPLMTLPMRLAAVKVTDPEQHRALLAAAPSYSGVAKGDKPEVVLFAELRQTTRPFMMHSIIAPAETVLLCAPPRCFKPADLQQHTLTRKRDR
jgi:hypothetical protein